MDKYIQRTIEELTGMDNGMLANPTDWASTPVTELAVKAQITSLSTKGQAVANAEQALSEARAAANAENKLAIKLAEQVIDLAFGIYAATPDKLVEYGIKPRKTPEKIPPPVDILAIDIQNDTDAEGFILALVAKDSVADSYEWQKGQGADPKDTSTIPPMSFYKQTSKIRFVDDNVQKGVRYFYRVRALNRNGQGPWSEAFSKVQ